MKEYYKAAIELTNEYDNSKILNLSAGTGILTHMLYENIHKVK